MPYLVLISVNPKEYMMTIRVTLSCLVKPDSLERLKKFLAENLPNVRNFAGCSEVNVYFDQLKQEMLIEERWLSIKQHQTYLKHIEDNGVLAGLGSFFQQAPEIKYFSHEKF
jgi:quinol monooxygenase YgiN